MVTAVVRSYTLFEVDFKSLSFYSMLKKYWYFEFPLYSKQNVPMNDFKLTVSNLHMLMNYSNPNAIVREIQEKSLIYLRKVSINGDFVANQLSRERGLDWLQHLIKDVIINMSWDCVMRFYKDRWTLLDASLLPWRLSPGKRHHCTRSHTSFEYQSLDGMTQWPNLQLVNNFERWPCAWSLEPDVQGLRLFLPWYYC